MGVALAQWDTAHGSISTLTATTPLHFHNEGAVVWRKSVIGAGASPLSAIQSSNAKYDIIAQEYSTFNDGAERYNKEGQDDVTEATSAGAPYAGDAQLSDATTPFFYLVRRSAGNDRSLDQLVHETDLLNEAEADAYITANVAAWVG